MAEILKSEDLIGTTYGRLTILEEGVGHREPNGKLQRVMICECSCGNIAKKQLKALRKGTAKSCGCIHKEQKLDITTSTKFGHWTVLQEVEHYVDKKGNKLRKVEAECVCGVKKGVILQSLVSGQSTSCGCMIEYKSTPNINKGLKLVNIDSPIIPLDISKVNERDLGHWTVLEEISAERNKKAEIVRIVKAQCKCGYTKETNYSNLGEYKQCKSCAGKERSGNLTDDEREIRGRLKGIFGNMKSRCYNPNSKDYKNYGGRGIIICDEWLEDSQKFIEWANNNGYKIDEGLVIDREDNNGNYSPNNCRFTTQAENNRNLRRNVVTWEIVDKIRYGEYKDIPDKELAELLHCSRKTIPDIRNFKTWNK